MFPAGGRGFESLLGVAALDAHASAGEQVGDGGRGSGLSGVSQGKPQYDKRYTSL